jgi:hypothetical protein
LPGFNLVAPVPSRRHRRPKPHQRRALLLLAGCGTAGCTESVMRMHGFTRDQFRELVQIGFVATTAERVVERWQTVEVTRFNITEAGQRALGGPPSPRRENVRWS